MARHIGDVAQLVASKPAIVTHLLSRILFGQQVVDASRVEQGTLAQTRS